MRFALLGRHPDGVAVARALVATGRHDLGVVLDAPVPDFAPAARELHDLEEILADPLVELVIVAGAESVRGEQLRRTLQSERPVVCVYPPADRIEAAYQAAVIQADTKMQLIPALPDNLHPAYDRLAEIAGAGVRLLTWEQHRPNGVEGVGWSVLRRLGGEIPELVGFAAAEEWTPAEPLLISGRFEKGGLFQVTQLPAAGERDVLTLVTAAGEAELHGPTANGPARLRWRTGGDWQEETFGPWDRWAAFAGVIEMALANPAAPAAWQDAVRGMELDDALRRSVEKRRASGLEFQEYTEEVGVRSTLTLIGCGMIWLMLLVFIVSIWVEWARWAIVPMLVGFLGLLALKWLGRRP